MEHDPAASLTRNLSRAAARYRELERAISDPALFKDQRRTRELLQEHAALGPIVGGHRRLQELQAGGGAAGAAHSEGPA